MTVLYDDIRTPESIINGVLQKKKEREKRATKQKSLAFRIRNPTKYTLEEFNTLQQLVVDFIPGAIKSTTPRIYA